MSLNIDLFTAALLDATLRQRARANMQAYLSNAGDPNQRTIATPTRTLLTAAAASGWGEAIEDLLATGADVHADGDWALRLAAANGHCHVVEHLLSHCADVHAEHDMALRLAAFQGHLPVVDRLLAAGANVHADQGAALRWAAGSGHLPVVKHLLSSGADIHARHDEALRNAARDGHRHTVEHLLAAGASASQTLIACIAETKPAVCRMLNTVAYTIPADQRQDLIEMAPRRFPALRALRAAEQRQVVPRRAGAKRRNR